MFETFKRRITFFKDFEKSNKCVNLNDIMFKSGKFITKILPAILWMLIIFLLSNIPGDQYPQESFDYGSIAHFFEFLILSYLLTAASGKYTFKKMLVVLTFCLLFALSDEWHQSFVPNRSVSLLDWLVDGVGTVAGLAVYYFKK